MRRAVVQAAAIVGACLVIGVLQGLLWAFLAPGIPYKVLSDGRYGALPTTSTYHFVDVAAFALSGMVIGIVLAVALWQFRSTRGWQALLALVGGSLLGALTAWGIGILVAPGMDPASVGPGPADIIITAPPDTGTVLVVLAQPALAAAVYTFLVAWNGHPDLDVNRAVGRRRTGRSPAVP
jgi:hypothetical protein